MYTSKFSVLLVTLALMFTLTPNTSASTAISYQSIDLPDNTSGLDLWRFDYQITGDFAAFESFSVFFDATSYQDLQILDITTPAAWSLFAVQPDINLGDGYVNALALNPIIANPVDLSVEFIWLGAGKPGSQSFEVSDDLFQVVQSGATQPAIVPIPGALILNLTGLLLLAPGTLLKSNRNKKQQSLD